MKKLEWDSEFWGINYYHLESLIEIDQANDNTIFYQIMIDESDFRDNLIHSGFCFWEAKIDMIKSLQNMPKQFKGFGPIKPEKLAERYCEFYSMYASFSRFRVFDSAKLRDFYYKWLVDSIFGQLDSNSFGYYIDDDLAGFATYHIEVDTLRVGLVGVFPEYQKKGISQKIMAQLEWEAKEHNLKNIKISTNTLNIPAINAYVKSGYIIDSIQYWFCKMKQEK